MRALLLRSSAFVVAGLFAAACSSTDDAVEAPEPNSDGGAGVDGSSVPPTAEASVPRKPDAGADATASGPSCTNQKKDGTETGVDCGGSCSNKCLALGGCAGAPDCAAGRLCVKNTCASPAANDGITGGACVPPGRNDGVKNANETDIDCGGGAPAAACGTGMACVTGTGDCESLVCTGNLCQAASGEDGVKNGNESDLDCGGTNTGAPNCGVALLCNAHSDCASDGCAYSGRCAAGRSCTGNLGGDTCGTGEVGEGGASHQSCCATAALDSATAKIDKFHVTAGRMRAFIERVNGDARTSAATSAGWNANWSQYVPSTVAEANKFLGPQWLDAPNQNDSDPVSKRSCNAIDFGGHTYWTPASAGGSPSDYTQAQLDPKALNCVGWHLARAFCAWDGGRLATSAELKNAFTNKSTTTNPWDWQHPEAWAAGGQDYRLNHQFSYGYPGTNPPKVNGDVRDIAWFVAPPGRFHEGRNSNGVEDIGGNLLHYSNDSEYAFT